MQPPLLKQQEVEESLVLGDVPWGNVLAATPSFPLLALRPLPHVDVHPFHTGRDASVAPPHAAKTVRWGRGLCQGGGGGGGRKGREH